MASSPKTRGTHCAFSRRHPRRPRRLASCSRRSRRGCGGSWRRGLDAEADVMLLDAVAEESAVLAGINSAPIQGRIALGRRAGGRVWRLGEEPDAPWVASNAPRHAHLDGFDLHANIMVPAGTGRGSSSFAAIRCARRSRRSVCGSWATAASCSRSRRPGQTARAICSSSLSSWSKSWRP